LQVPSGRTIATFGVISLEGSTQSVQIAETDKGQTVDPVWEKDLTLYAQLSAPFNNLNSCRSHTAV